MANITHGQSGPFKTKTYRAWINMKKRCGPGSPDYSYYGARGIKVCRRWQRSFKAFAMDMRPPPSPSHTLDRIDNDEGYHARNCRWTLDQNSNRRNNIWVNLDGERVTAIEAAKRTGVSQKQFRHRLRKKDFDKP